MEEHTPSIDVCIVCALPAEAIAFRDVVQQLCQVETPLQFNQRHGYHYWLATIKNNANEPLHLHISWLARYGQQEMARHAQHIVEAHYPRIVIMTGICAGDAQHVILGDLVVGERTFTYDSGRFVIENGRQVHEHDTQTYNLDASILSFLGVFEAWKPLVAHMKRPQQPTELSKRKITCHLKAIASGNAVRKDAPFKDVQMSVRGAVAIDMEGAALGLVMSHYPTIPWLIVKGVSDYADGAKNDDYHTFAERTSARYALSFIRAYVSNERLPRYNRPVSPYDLTAAKSKQLIPAQITPDRFGDLFPPVWNVPYRHAPYFTGRNQILEQIFDTYTSDQGVPYQALIGLGGLGKTQTAVEYAYRYRKYYQKILWIRAESEYELLTQYKSMAELLELPEAHLKQPESLLASMQEWFRNTTDWLLIIDNADNLVMVEPFLPRFSSGHLLLTSRASALGSLAQPLALAPMTPDDGALCILRRANYIPWRGQLSDASPVSVKAAEELSQLMDGLPLALEQAGAYIETTGRSVSEYLDLYRQYRPKIQQHQYGVVPNYREAVAFAWNIAKEAVQKENNAALELLYLFAFLAPEAIPFNLFPEDEQILGPILGPVAANPLSLNQAISLLRGHSLIKNEVNRDTDKSQLSIHRVFQEVLRDNMDPLIQPLWVERAVRVLENARFNVERPIILAHIQACLLHVDHWGMNLPEAETLRHYVAEKQI